MGMKNFTFSGDELPVGIVIIDKWRKIIFGNKLFFNITGFAKPQLVHQSIDVIKIFNNQNAEQLIDIKHCLEQQTFDSLSRSVWLQTASNKLKLMFIQARELPEGEKLLAFTDISEEVDCHRLFVSSPADELLLHQLIGKAPIVLNIKEQLQLASESNATVLISGESGTGKEVMAHIIHQLSARNNKPFIKVNCSALSETLLESELFGHVKGSFTGAYKDKTGKFEAAHQGTILLDEIGEISPMLQVKLLRVIQEKTIERVGDNKPIKVDMRIIAATNRNLKEMVREGKFREDLFYRLNVFPISTVPLREHLNDLPLLCEHFIKKFSQQTGKNILGITEDAYRVMLDYCWPGNVRELENSIEFAFVVCKNKMIDVFDLPQDIRMVEVRKGACKGFQLQKGMTISNEQIKIEPVKIADNLNYSKNISKEELIALLQHHKWKITETAQAIGISRVALWKKMKKFGI